MTYTLLIAPWTGRATTVPTQPCTCAGTATRASPWLTTVWLLRYPQGTALTSHSVCPGLLGHRLASTPSPILPWQHLCVRGRAWAIKRLLHACPPLCMFVCLHTHALLSSQQGFASAKALKERNFKGNPGYPRTELFLWVSSILLEDKLSIHDIFL